MRRIGKNLLSYLLVIMMLILTVPMLSVSASAAVDLIHNSDGTIKEGVYISNVGGQFEASFNLDRAFNNSTADSWCSAWSPGTYAYLQVNFPVAQQLTEIKIAGATSADYRVNYDVYVSNDITFNDSLKVHSQTTSYTSGQFIKIDMTGDSTPYRYIRVITTSSGLRFGIGEIDVIGYESELPDTSGDSILTDRADVCAIASDEYGENYVAQNAVDGNEDTYFFTSGSVEPYFQVDLRRKSLVSKIEFIGHLDVDYEGTRKNYDVFLSNDPNFNNSVLVYKRLGTPTKSGEWVTVYSIDDEEYRYVRIQPHSANTQIAVSEIRVWGTEAVENLQVEELAQMSTVTATSEGTPAAATTDGDFKTYWLCWDETGKASITYTFADAKIVTSIAVFPLYNKGDDSKRKDFNIYGSEDGTFEDAYLIASVEQAINNGCFTSFGIDDIKAYKAIRIESTIEPTQRTGMGFNEVKIISDSSDTAVEVVSTLPSNGASNVTNIEGKDNFIEVELNRTVNVGTITPQNIIIKASDDTVVSDWEVYSAIDKKFKIDISCLKSKTTYDVTLTTGVKTGSLPLTKEYTFSFTTGAIINVPYTQGKIIKNVALNKTVTGNPHLSSGPLSAVVDANEANYALTNGAPKVQVDLGNCYDIVAFELTPQNSAANNMLLKNLNILGSNVDLDIANITAADATNLVLATYPGSSTSKETLVLDSPVRTRYLGLWRASTYMVISEFKAYALVSEDFGTWSVKTGGAEATKITQAGQYTFSIPVTNYESNGDYYMVVSAYNEAGALVSLVCDDVSASKGTKTTLSKSISIDDSVVLVQAMLLSGRSDTKIIADVKTITKQSANVPSGTASSQTNEDLSDAITYTTSDTGFKISAASSQTGAITPADRIGVFVLKPGSSFTGNLPDSAFDSALCYAQGTSSIKAGNVAEFTFILKENMPYGKYNVKVSLTRADGSTDNAFYYFNNIDPAEVSAFIDEFQSFTLDDGMASMLRKYTDEKELIRWDQISELKNDIPLSFEQMYIYFRDVYLEEHVLITKNDVVTCLTGAYVLSTFEEGNEGKTEAALKKYSGSEIIKAIYDIDADTGKFLKVYADLKANITDKDSLKNILKWSCVLSYIQNGTRKDVKEAIEKNAVFLGCDLQYAQDKGVSIDAIVMHINTSKASEYYDGKLGTVFKSIADSLAGSQADRPSGPSGSSKPVSIGSFNGAYVSGDSSGNETVAENPAQNVQKELPFNDIVNITWAKDYIVSLNEKGIIRGNGDGTFAPNRYVSREEFVKMLVEALEINVVSGVDTGFYDCNPDGWYYPYIQIAVSNKIVNGIDKNNFGVGQYIMRQDMAVMTEKAMALKNVTAIEGDNRFADDAAIGKYAKSAVSKMNALGIINGFDDGSIRPQEGTTRAQAAVIIARVLECLEEVAK